HGGQRAAKTGRVRGTLSGPSRLRLACRRSVASTRSADLRSAVGRFFYFFAEKELQSNGVVINSGDWEFFLIFSGKHFFKSLLYALVVAAVYDNQDYASFSMRGEVPFRGRFALSPEMRRWPPGVVFWDPLFRVSK
ncbi:unnamed protein product, partial [Laminaria digitata]